MNDIISKFTTHLKNALTRALCLVVETKGDAITPIHLLWALSTQQGCVASEILTKSGINLEELRLRAGDNGTIPLHPTSHEQNFVPTLSEEAKAAIEKAVLTANLYEHRYVGTEHLLSGLIQALPSDVSTFFTSTNADMKAMQANLATVFKTTANFPEFSESQKSPFDALQELEEHPFDELRQEDEEDESKTPAIDYFTEEMTAPEALKDITPVIGRQHEVERLAKILSRKQKNNPILVGKPGVGKTAIVEGLAKKIVEGDVPPALLGRRIFRLDLASMLAGTMYRGEFESRLRQLLEEIADRPEVILFIDEVHTIMGAGAASGSLDASNMLKPALARGEVRCIGATTPAEYKRHIEPDGALERRFQQITVSEPTAEETKHIISGIKTYFESHHGVSYTDEAIERAVELADRYFPGKAFPDKAIDLVDEAGAAAAMKRRKSSAPTLQELKTQLDRVREDKRAAVVEEEFKQALELKQLEEDLENRIAIASEKKPAEKTITVDESLIEQTVADICKIPVSELTAAEHKRYRELAKTLKSHVVGQDEVVDTVARAVQRAKLGLAREDKPLASFLFLGPSGVGKTLLAKMLAKTLFHDEEHFLRLDMSEYAEPYTISKLIGSPAGYVGYRETTKLTDHVKQYPHSVVLFDEIEKAHRDVHNLLLQILDDGMLTDATGRKINFRNTLIILTSNVGREYFTSSGLGFQDSESSKTRRSQDLRVKLEEFFKPELLNRINHIHTFRPLTKEDYEQIADLELKKLQERLKKQNISCTIRDTVLKQLLKQPTEIKGARALLQEIEQQIEHPVAEHILRKRKKPAKIRIGTKAGNIHIESFER